MTRPPVALTIAGTDSGGGAGIAADLKTFEAHGVWGTCAVVAVTAQNTLGVHDAGLLPASLVRRQIEAVVTDIGVDAAKTGMLASTELVEAVAAAVHDFGVPDLVVDPVLVSKHGDPLLAGDAVASLREALLPLAAVVTPNLSEASALTGIEIADRAGMEAAARALAATGVGAVLVKGGHLEGGASPDVLLVDGRVVWLEGERVAGRHAHGTGCTLSAAIAALLARRVSLEDACRQAKAFVAGAIRHGVALGGGVGPVNPGWQRGLWPGPAEAP